MWISDDGELGERESTYAWAGGRVQRVRGTDRVDHRQRPVLAVRVPALETQATGWAAEVHEEGRPDGVVAQLVQADPLRDHGPQLGGVRGIGCYGFQVRGGAVVDHGVAEDHAGAEIHGRQVVFAGGLQDEAPILAGHVGGVVELEGPFGAAVAGVDHVEGDGRAVGYAEPEVGVDARCRHCCCGTVS